MKVHYRAFHGPTDWGWVQSHLPLKRVEDTNGIMAIDLDKNETVAGAIFDTWTTTAVQAHLIVQNPMVLRHGFLEECCDFVFNVAGRDMMIGLVPSDKEAALKLNPKIGFTELVRIPQAVEDDVDMVVMIMRREDCNFLPEVELEQAYG